MDRPNFRHIIPPGETPAAAKRFGLCRRQMRRIATGEAPASLEAAIRIAAGYPGRVSLEELLHLSIPPGVAVRKSEVSAAA